jgi:hypothetical protein
MKTNGSWTASGRCWLFRIDVCLCHIVEAPIVNYLPLKLHVQAVTRVGTPYSEPLIRELVDRGVAEVPHLILSGLNPLCATQTPSWIYLDVTSSESPKTHVTLLFKILCM